MFPFGETVTVLRSGDTTYDDWGHPVTTSTEVDVPGAVVAPRREFSGENTDRQETVTTGLAVYLPAGTDVRFDDRIRIRGAVWEVVGEAAVWASPYSSWRPGVEVSVRRVH